MRIEKSMTIAQLIQKHPQAVNVLMSHGMGCIGCPASRAETIEQASMVHGISLENLLGALRGSDPEETT